MCVVGIETRFVGVLVIIGDIIRFEVVAERFKNSLNFCSSMIGPSEKVKEEAGVSKGVHGLQARVADQRRKTLVESLHCVPIRVG